MTQPDEVPDKYAGACWNQLMENESKESIAEMYIDSLDENRTLRQQVAGLKAERDAANARLGESFLEKVQLYRGNVTLKAERDETVRMLRIESEAACTLKARAEQAEARCKRLESKYAFAENQSLCVGYDGECDGDLVAIAHEESCPARSRDTELRPYLYAASAKEQP